MSRAENAIERLYESAALRGELTDDPANRVLKWAEDQLIALDETAADDAAFEAGEAALIAKIKQINSTVGTTLSAGGAISDADAQAFSAQAAAAGAAVSDEQVKAAATPDEMTLVENLIALFSADAASAQSAPIQTASVQTATAQPPIAQAAPAQVEGVQVESVETPPAQAEPTPSEPSPPAAPDPATPPASASPDAPGASLDQPSDKPSDQPPDKPPVKDTATDEPPSALSASLFSEQDFSAHADDEGMQDDL